MMRYTNQTEAKVVASPNFSALQHAGLAAVLVVVILFSLIEMTRTAISHPAALPGIVQTN